MKLTIPGTSPKTSVTALVDFIRSRLALGNLPTRLKELGVSIEDLALSADDCANLELMNGLLRSMSTDDLFDLIKQAY